MGGCNVSYTMYVRKYVIVQVHHTYLYGKYQQVAGEYI